MKKTQKRHALLMSALSLLLCVSMLVGTTFAWFTDEVTSGMNIIAAGNLDIELLADGVKVESDTKLFADVALWEPGVVVYENLQIANVGSLALKYQMNLNFGKENTLNGHKLSEVLQIAIVDPIPQGADRAAVLASVQNATSLEDFSIAGSLTAGAKTEEKAVVIFWAPGENDNLYNANNGQKTSDKKPLSIEFGVKLFATQQTEEKDSFDHLYDDAAAWTGEIDVSWYDPAATEFILTSPEDLAGFAAIVNGAAANADTFQGKTVKLGANLDLSNISWTPIGDPTADGYVGFQGTFDGQGYAICNLKVNNTSGWGQGLFGYFQDRGAVVQNLKVHNASVKGEDTSGVIAGYAYFGTFSNIQVTGDVSVIGNEHVGGIVGNGYYANFENCSVIADEGSVVKATVRSFAAGIVGYHGEGALKVNGCTVKGLNIEGNGAVGGITGLAHYGNIIDGNTVEDVTLTITRKSGSPSLGAVAGCYVYNATKPATITNNTVKNVTLKGAYDSVVKDSWLYGSEYNGKTDVNFVLDNNTEEGIVNELTRNVKDYYEMMATAGTPTNYALTDDMVAEDRIFFRPGTDNSIDLGNHTITAGNPGQYLFIAQTGGTLELNGKGTVNAGKGFMASQGSATIEINGGTYNTTATGTLNDIKHHSFAQNGGKIVINDGVFTSNVADAVLFFATSNSRIEINGGFFENTATKTPDLLGIGNYKYDTNRIVITGGTFVNYNPLEDQMCYKGAWPAAGEAGFGGPWILIPGDYQVVSETQANGDIWYSVVAK